MHVRDAQKSGGSGLIAFRSNANRASLSHLFPEELQGVVHPTILYTLTLPLVLV